MQNCLFCRIASHDIDAKIVLDRDNVVAFRDINPQAPTHILLIPRQHIAHSGELGPEHAGFLAELFAAAAELAEQEGIAEDGYRVVTNVGPAAGQSVLHLHFHLLGGRQMAWPPG
ncbi:MAG: HIT domain-containing protein [Actinomycetota bacterium]